MDTSHVRVLVHAIQGSLHVDVHAASIARLQAVQALHDCSLPGAQEHTWLGVQQNHVLATASLTEGDLQPGATHNNTNTLLDAAAPVLERSLAAAAAALGVDGCNVEAIAQQAQQLTARSHALVARHLELCGGVASAMAARLTLLQQALHLLLQLADDGAVQRAKAALTTTVQLACSEAETVVLRLRVLRAKVLSDTYSEECIAALQQARAALATQLSDTATQLRKARAKLHAYHEAGPPLSALAARYAALCREVEHAHYSLDEVLGGLNADLGAR